MKNDQIFPIQGDLAINWCFADKACRIVLIDQHVGESNADDDNTHVLGNNYYIIMTKGKVIKQRTEVEIVNIQYCSYDSYRKKYRILQGTDPGSEYQSGPA